MLKLAGETDLGILEAHEAALASHLPESLAVLLKGGSLIHIPTNAGWIASTTGSGGSSQLPFTSQVDTGATGNSSGLLQSVPYGLSPGTSSKNYISWDKKLYLIFNYCRVNSDAEVVARVQLKETASIGELAAKGVGIRVDNLSLLGESYGTVLGTVNLNTTLADDKAKQIVIILYPATKIEWYVDGVLVGTQSTTNKIPTGEAGATSRLVHSIANGATGGVGTVSLLMHPKIWQAR